MDSKSEKLFEEFEDFTQKMFEMFFRKRVNVIKFELKFNTKNSTLVMFSIIDIKNIYVP